MNAELKHKGKNRTDRPGARCGGACAKRNRHGPAITMKETFMSQALRRSVATLTAPFVLPVLQTAGLFICVWIVLWPQLDSSFEASRRYRTAAASDWNATNVWLESADCARETGAWLVICDQGKLIPISDKALADDPGHALILAWWSRLADRTVTLVDVAHLNLTINLVGLVLLAATLLCLRAYVPTVILLTLGPYIFLEWFGTSPHWALIGVSAMQPLLPLGLLARWQRWVSPTGGLCLILMGLVTLAFASLIREAIAQMTLVVTLSVLIWITVASWRRDRRLAGVLVVALATLFASQTARLTVIVRDKVYQVEPAELVATHGMAHTLYIGLGAVENKFGIRYDDSVGREAAAKVAPDVKYLSRDYFRVMWSLYFARWSEDPLEVSRVYFEKMWVILGNRILDSAPAPWLFFTLVVAIHWLANGRAASCGSAGCDKRLAINVICLSFTGLFVAQAILAHPTRFYSAPIGVFMLVTLGVTIANLAHWFWHIAKFRLGLALR